MPNESKKAQSCKANLLFILSFTLLAVFDIIFPAGVTFSIFSTSSFILFIVEVFIIEDKCLDIPPTFSSIDISLSFKITIILGFISPK